MCEDALKQLLATFFNPNIMKLSLFLSSRPFSLASEIFCMKSVIVACSYAVSNSGPVHTYEQREKKPHSDLIVACSLSAHMYVLVLNWKLPTNKQQ